MSLSHLYYFPMKVEVLCERGEGVGVKGVVVICKHQPIIDTSIVIKTLARSKRLL